MSSSDLYFSADLRSPAGIERGELLPFQSLEALCCDIYAGIPETAADLLRQGFDPLACAYLLRDEHGCLLLEIGFAELLRGGAVTSAQSDDQWREVNADLQRRSDAAIDRLGRATAWVSRIAARVQAVGDRSS